MAGPLDTLEAFALDLPGAFADMPWEGDVVAKVGKKIFVFFGSGDPPTIAVKLPDSADHALATPGRPADGVRPRPPRLGHRPGGPRRRPDRAAPRLGRGELPHDRPQEARRRAGRRAD